MLLVNLAEPASLRGLQIVNIFPVVNVAFEDRIFGFAAFVFHRVSSGPKLWPLITQATGCSLYVRLLADGFVVVEGDNFARPHFLGRATETERLYVIDKN